MIEMNNIPKDWKESSLKELTVNLDNLRIPLKSSDRQNRKGIYPYYGAQGVIDYIDDYIFEGKHLLVAEDGENVKSRKNDIALIADGKFWVNNHAHVILNNDKSDLEYLKYFLNYMDIRPYVTGLAQPKLNKGSLEKLKILTPDIPEQQKIAEILSTVDAKIEVIDQQIQETQELKKGLMQRLLTKGIGHTEFKDSPLGEIPKNWEVMKLGDLFKLSSGVGLSKANLVEGFYPVYGGNGIAFYHNEYTHEAPQLIVGRVGAKCGCIHKTEQKSWITDNALIIHTKLQNYNDSFMEYLLRKVDLNKYANKNAQPVISGSKIYPIQVALPPFVEQERISKILSNVDNKISVLENKKNSHQDLKKGLMQQLLTGKIRVKV